MKPSHPKPSAPGVHNAAGEPAAPFLKSVSLDPHYVAARQPSGKVVGVWGQAVVRKPDGAVLPLHTGDEVHKGDVILTSQDGIVQLEAEGTRYAYSPGPLDDLDPTGAGLGGGDGSGLQPALRVDRVALSTTSSEYQFAFDHTATSAPTGDTRPDTGTPVLSVSSVSVAEGAGFAQFTVSLSHASNVLTSLHLNVSGGSATAGQDFGTALEFSLDGGHTWVAGNDLSLPAGQTSALVRVPVLQDTLVEGNETFNLDVTRSGGITANAGATGAATIIDDDSNGGAPTVVSVHPVGHDVVEGNPLVYTVTLSNAADSPTSFAYSIGGTATPGEDYSSPTFSNGVTLVDGQLVVPAGVTSFTVTLPTIDDTIDEAPRETAVLNVGGVSAEGGILDNDGPPTVISVEPGAPGADGDNVVEGNPLVYTVTLSNAADSPTSFAYSIGGTATPGEDYSSPTFSNGVTLVDGHLVVPAGVTSFTVTMPTIDDTISEAPRETAILNVGGVSAEGGILDNDGPPTVISVEPGAPGADGDNVVEGNPLVYTVTLSNAADSPTSFAYSIGGTATPGEDYSSPTFSNGVTLVDGQLVVPAGVTSFTVTLPTIDDTIDEAPRETAVLSVGGVSAEGGILDNDGPPTVISVEPGAPGADGDNVVEGNPLVYTVTLSNAADSPTSFAYSIGGTATPGEDYSSPTFSNGVTLVDGQLVVPAGVTSFTVTLPTIDDTIDEAPRETAVLSVGGVSAEGGILDNDGPPTVISVEPGAPGADGDNVVEGNPLVYTVTLSNAADSPTSFAYSIGGTATPGEDYSSPTFSNGVTLVDGQLVVPAGVTSFTVTLPTIDDTIDEAPRETAVLNVGGVSAEGGILDNDGPPTVISVEPGAPGADGDNVVEGNPLVYTVTLSNAADSPTSFAYSIGGTATPGEDYSSPTFSNGVTLVDGQLVVPAGVTSFTVTLPTIDDTIDEAPRETAVLSVGGVSAEGGILDNDEPPTVISVEPGAPGADGDNVVEGNPLVYTVTLSNAADSPTSFAYSIGGTATPGEDYSSPTFSNGVALVDGQLVVPAGVTSFTVTLPTIDDTIDEAPRETAVLSVGGVSAEGGILDNDGPPTVISVEPGAPGADGDNVVEGNPLVYTVTLSNAADSPTSFAYSIGGTATPGEDYSSPTFSNGVTLVDGQLVVPAGVTSFTVTLPTIDDTIDEAPRETAVLSVGGVSAEGGILDNDGPPTVISVEPGAPGADGDNVVEGNPLVYTVTLSNAADSPTSFAYSIGGTATPGEDYSSPTFSNGVTLVDGHLVVPAGVTSFTVTLPTIDDTIDEAPRETAVLSVGGVSAEGGILDNDGPPTVVSVEPGAPGADGDNVVEGNPLVYTVTLSNAADSPTSFAYSIGGTATPGEDYSSPTFSNGVTLVDGQLVVPAGVTSFTVTLPTIDDTIDEAPRETAVLSVGGVSAEGGILDNDEPPTVISVEPGAPGADGDNVVEGNPLVYTVTLSNAADSPTSFAYSIGGTATPGEDYSSPTFSNGVALVDGQLVVPAGVTSFTVTLPTIDDTIDEAPRETAVLSVGGVSAEGGILDNDGPPTVISVEPGAPGADGDNVVEGNPLVYTVTLSNAADSPTSFAYSIGGTATPGEDYSSPTFSNGVTLVDGQLVVPAGVTSFTVTLPTIDDTIDEAPRETAVLSVGGVSAEGGILDNDGPPTVISVEPGAPGADGDNVVEGNPLVYTVTLSNAADSPTSFAYSIGGTATPGEDYSSPTFSNGVTLVDGHLVVPAGVTSFTVTLPTIDDTIDEAPRETAVLSVGGVSAEGGILDNDGPPTVVSVEPGAPGADGDNVVEGNPLVYTVTLSNAADSPTSFAYSIGGTATPGEDYSSPTFSNGVTLVDGQLVVPAGVTSFTVTLPTIDDTIDEAPRETAVLSVGGVSAEGGILDNDEPPTVISVEPGAPGADGDNVVEGNPLVYTVTLSNAADSPTSFAYSIGGTATPGEDYSSPTFSNGVALVDGQLVVPAGVTSFTVTLPTIDDTIDEAPRETAVLSVGGVSAEGGILDNDGPPTVISVEPGAPGADGDNVVEGNPLVYTVTLSNAADSPTSFAYSIGGTATPGEDYSSPTFSNGVTLVDGQLVVPAGVTSFTVTLPTIDDTIDEAPRETAVLSVGGVSAEGGILDNDGPPTVISVEPGAPGADGDNVVEGNPLVYTVTLSNAADSPTSFAYSIGGTATPGEDYSSPTFSNGVTLVDGQLVVPAGVTSFTVTLPTIDDTIDEAPRETAVLSVGGVSAEGGILDNDGPPTVISVEPGAPGADGDNVVEGNPLVYTVTLSNAADSPTSFAYSIGGTATPGEDYSSPTFSNGVTLVDGQLVVPAGVTSFTVTLPTIDDTIDEAPRETAVLNVGGVSAEGGILDNDGPPTVISVEPGAPGADGDNVVEGNPLVYTVTLSNAADSPTSFAYSIGGTATPGEDYSSPTFSNGVTLVDGHLVVPAGVTSFTVTLPTIDDTIDEAPRETAVLSVGGVSAEGGILDNDGPPTVISVEPGAPGADGDNVVEGNPLVYTVTLSNAADSPTSFAYSIGGTATPGEDYSSPTFSNGVMLVDGQLVVPAGVTSFTVTLPTIDDTIDEAPRETAVLSVGGVSAEGGILDNDGPPTVISVEPGAPGADGDNVVEGNPLVYTVTLSNAADSPTSFAYSIGGTATPGEDYSSPTFSNGVTLVDGQLVVPAGVTSFTVTLPTIDDTIDEAPRETAVLSVGGVSAEGGILDNDVPPTVISVEPGAPGADGDNVVEGNPLVYTVTLSNAADSPTSFAYSIGGTATPGEDYSSPTFSNGVTLVDGHLVVPAGVTSFTVTLPTIDDTISEAPRETAILNVGGVSAEGGILDNDTPPEGCDITVSVCEDQPLTLSLTHFPMNDAEQGVNVAPSAVRIDTLPIAGVLTLSGHPVSAGEVVTAADIAAGQLVFTPAPDANGQAYAGFTFSVCDATGLFDLVPNTLTIDVQPVNDLPDIGHASATLSEEALPHGIGADASDATVRTGTLTVTDVDAEQPALSLLAPTQPVTSGGQTLHWVGTGTPDNPLIGEIECNGVTTPILQASIGWVAGQAQYTVSLLGPIDHRDDSGNPVDALTLDFGVRADDGHGTPVVSATALQVTIEDDTPAAPPAQEITLHTQDTNLLLVLDTSGSMAEHDGNGSGATRLEVAVSAMIKLLQGYENAGNVMVTLVNFSDQGHVALPWMSATDAVAWLQDPSHLTANGATNYDDALAKAQAAFEATGRLTSAENVAYFFSDGQPNRPTKSPGINGSEQADWEIFLKQHDIDAYAIGLGNGVPSSALNPIAYDGNNERDPVDHTLLVNDLTQLDHILAGTVPAPISGHLVQGSTGLEDTVGADGGYVRSLQVDGITYTYDPADGAHPISGAPDGSYRFDGSTLTVSMAHGSLSVNMADGSYAFQPNASGSGQFSETVQYSLSDRDGDVVSSSVTFNGQHMICGGDGANTLHGTDGADLIRGGAGNDVMTGGLGSDVFAWQLADRGSHACPAHDTITDFNLAPAASGGDVLDLRDLLQGESRDAASLDRYLDFTSSCGSTTVHIASQGAPTANATAAQDQTIVLSGVDLGSLGSNDTAIIQHLLDQGKLLVDQNGSRPFGP